MEIRCPSCGAVHSLETVMSHEAARSALARAMQFTPLGQALIRYLALWRPAKRQLGWDRVATLLDELLTWVEAAQIERHGRAWPAPREYWIAAIEEMIARRDSGRLQTPLKSHGYLLEILAGMSDRAEAQAERRAEDRAAGRTPVGGAGSNPTAPPPPPPPPREEGRKIAADAIARARAILNESR